LACIAEKTLDTHSVRISESCDPRCSSIADTPPGVRNEPPVGGRV
jgi:hypothetical protein